MCAQCSLNLLNTVQVCQVLADRSLDTMPPTQVNPELPPAEGPGQKRRKLSAGAPNVHLEEIVLCRFRVQVANDVASLWVILTSVLDADYE